MLSAIIVLTDFIIVEPCRLQIFCYYYNYCIRLYLDIVQINMVKAYFKVTTVVVFSGIRFRW